MASHVRWSNLGNGPRTAIVVAGVAEVCLTIAAARDLRRRPSVQIRGPKKLWWAGIFIQPVGPIAYLTWARHK